MVKSGLIQIIIKFKFCLDTQILLLSKGNESYPYPQPIKSDETNYICVLAKQRSNHKENKVHHCGYL